MTPDRKPRSRGIGHFGRFTLVGFFTIAPLWVTWLVFDFLFGLFARAGQPLLSAAAIAVAPISPTLASWLFDSGFQQVVALLLTLLLLYGIGLFATFVIGRKIIGWFEGLLVRLPLVQTIYGGTKRLLQSLRKPPASGQRVVLIAFPNDRMRTIGFVTRTIVDADDGRELAIVYVPTAPNPTSGYIEIVAADELIPLDWTTEQAMSFVMTAGTTSADSIPFSRGAGRAAAAEASAREMPARETPPG